MAHDLELLEQWHPEAVEYCEVAAEVGLEDRVALKHDGLRPSICAEQIVAGFVDHVAGGGWLAWKTMLNVVVAIMLANPRYYGITDPVREQCCVACRSVLPLSAFRNGRIRCRPCEEAYAPIRMGVREQRVPDRRLRSDP